MTKPTCPDVRNLQALLEAGGSGDEPDEVVRHLETCASCQQTLENLSADLGNWEAMAYGLGQPARREQALRQVVEQLKREEPMPADAGELPFLRPADQPGLLGLLGPYEVREVIGRGGMGVVLKAFDPALNRVVALKVLAPGLAGSPTARWRFVREARAAAAVSHQHVVPVHGVSEGRDFPFLVMQYVAGESLQTRLDRSGPLDVEAVVRIGLQAASGLAAAHAQGLIHRDIKPANLLLENGLARVKITDFGLARMTDDVGLTRDGVVSGTPEYMAPEQARGEAVDHRADLYSLGAVLYACCTGVPPFRGAAPLAVLRQVNDEEPAPIRSQNPAVSAWLETLVVRLMAKDPAERFQSAAEVAALLEGYLAHLRQPAVVPAPELPPSPAGRRPASLPPARGRVRRWRRGPLWFLGVLAALATLGLLRWLLAGGASPPQNAAGSEFYQDFRGNNPPLASLGAWAGRDGDETIEPQDRGLRIALPAGRQRTDPVGLLMRLTLKGDFEITTGYELLQADRPRGGNGVGYELYVTTDTPSRNALAFGRVTRTDGSEEYGCTGMTTVEGKRKYTGTSSPASARSGKLRVTRHGAEVTFWVGEGDATEFRELFRYDLGPEDVNGVRLSAYPGQAPEAVDVRIVDLKVRSDAPIPDLPPPGSSVAAGRPGGIRKGIALALTLGLTGAAALGVLIVLSSRARRGRGAAEAPAPPSTNEEAARPKAAAFVSFPCSECGKKLKVGAGLVGKKVKCPGCGKAVPVPGDDAFRAGRPPV